MFLTCSHTSHTSAHTSHIPPHTLYTSAAQGDAAAAQREAHLLALCSRSFTSTSTLVFCRTKVDAHRLKLLFGLL